MPIHAEDKLQMSKAERFLAKKAFALMLASSTSSLDRWVKTKPGFPQPINMGGRVRFLESEVSEWMQKTVEQSRNSGVIGNG